MKCYITIMIFHYNKIFKEIKITCFQNPHRVHYGKMRSMLVIDTDTHICTYTYQFNYRLTDMYPI